MAKIQDKLFNRVIEGDLLELSEADKERAGIGGGGNLIIEDYSALPTESELGTLKDGIYKLGSGKKYYIDNLKGSTTTNSILEMNYYGDRKYIKLTGNISIVFIGGVIIQVTVFYDKYEK